MDSNTNSAPTFTVGYGKLTTAIGSVGDFGRAMAIQADGKILLAGESFNGSIDTFALARYNPDGSLDTSFSGDGKLTTALGNRDSYVIAVAPQPDGKILLTGYSYNGSGYDYYLVRYHADGSLDRTFSDDGQVITKEAPTRVVFQPDGKILVAGYNATGSGNDFALVRYNANGTLDTSFDGDGKVTTDFNSGSDSINEVIVLPDGKILVAGYSLVGAEYHFAWARYNADGSLDTSFDGDGRLTSFFGTESFGDVIFQPDGKILVAGSIYDGNRYNFALARYTADGSSDTSFSEDGKATVAFGRASEMVSSVAVQSDGKIIVAGKAYIDGNGDDFSIARFNSDGSLDTSFDGDGKVNVNIRSMGASDDARKVIALVDGKILIAGTSDVGLGADFALVRLNLDGSLDSSFGASYSLGGSVAFTEGGAGVILDSSVAFADAELDAPNAGAGDYAGASITLARHGATSTADVFGFSSAGADFLVLGNSLQSGGQTFATYSQSAGRLSIAFTSSSTVATHALVENVLEHITYSNASKAPPTSVQIDWTLSDGNTGDQGAGGVLNSVGSTFVNITAVSNFNNAPDFSTLPIGIITTAIGTRNDQAENVAMQADGKILVAGYAYNGNNHDFALVRYNSGGNLDTSFSDDGKLATAIGTADDFAKSIVVQPDGKILVVGKSYSGSVGGISLNSLGAGGTPNWDIALVRYNTDGSLDTTFDGDGKLTTTFGSSNEDGESVVLQADGKIVVAGTSMGTNSNFALVRYNANGSLDATFGNGGGVTTDIGTNTADGGTSVAVQSDGKILVAGVSTAGSNDDFALARYNTNGTLDTSFSDDGKLVIAIGLGSDIAYSLALQADGKILVAGESSNGSNVDFSLIQLNADGTLDVTFSGDGKLTTALGDGHDLGRSLALQPDGKILVAGSSWNGTTYEVALVRFNTDGSLDTTFSGDGKLTTEVNDKDNYGTSVTVQADGKILVVGSSYNSSGESDFLVIRYNSDGTLDATFETVPNSGVTSTYLLGGAPVVLDASLFMRDMELDALNAGAGDYAGAFVTLNRLGGANSNDVFGFLSPEAQFSIADNQLQSNGQTFGTFSQANGMLTILFNSEAITATHALVLDVMEHVTYSNISNASPSLAQFDWFFSDGNQGNQGMGDAQTATGRSILMIDAGGELTSGNSSVVDLLAYSWKSHTLLCDVSVSKGAEVLAVIGLDAAHFVALTNSSLTLTASRAVPSSETTATGSAVNLQDAIAILKMIVGLDVNGAGKALSPYQSLAADFDSNGTVNLTDAIGVLKHVVGLTSPDPAWHFLNEADLSVPAKATLTPGIPAAAIGASLSGTSPVHVGLVGYLSGDVDGSYAGGGQSHVESLQADYFTALMGSHSGLSLGQFGVYSV